MIILHKINDITLNFLCALLQQFKLKE